MSLRPCPFCGSKEAKFELRTLTIQCQSCAAEGPFAGFKRGSNVKRYATNRWNKRHPFWIAVKDELPNYNVPTAVLIANSAWEYPVTEGYFLGGTWFAVVGFILRGEAPTHWMCLPEPPQESEAEI